MVLILKNRNYSAKLTIISVVASYAKSIVDAISRVKALVCP